jgi:signal transduction histidine kinase
MNEADQSYLQAAEETVHALAQRVQALETSARLLVSNSDGKLGATTNSSRESVYRIFKWRCQNGSLSDEDLTNLCDRMLREVDQFGAMIKNLVGFFSQSEPMKPHKRLEEMRPILEEVVDLFDLLAADKGVAIRLLLAGDPAARIDRDLVHRLLVNLCDNAVKYSYSTSPESGKRFISLFCRRHSTDGGVSVSISSYGVGVLEEEITSGSIFEYGRRGTLARDRERRGMGIGLAEAKRIAEAHGGSLMLRSEHQHGETYLTTVTVLLP